MGTLLNRGRKTSKRKIDAQRGFDALRRIIQSLRVASRAAQQEFGLTAAQLFVLKTLADGSVSSLNELAARTRTHQSTTSIIVQRLVQQGLVARTVSTADGRQVVLSLTARGRRMLNRSPQAAHDKLIDAMDDLPASDRKNLARLLARVAGAMHAG